jgi:hypothetical protein
LETIRTSRPRRDGQDEIEERGHAVISGGDERPPRRTAHSLSEPHPVRVGRDKHGEKGQRDGLEDFAADERPDPPGGVEDERQTIKVIFAQIHASGIIAIRARIRK